MAKARSLAGFVAPGLSQGLNYRGRNQALTFNLYHYEN